MYIRTYYYSLRCYNMYDRTVSITARFPMEDANLLKKTARDRREDVSSFVRRAVLMEMAKLGLLPDEQRKALGVDPLLDAASSTLTNTRLGGNE